MGRGSRNASAPRRRPRYTPQSAVSRPGVARAAHPSHWLRSFNAGPIRERTAGSGSQSGDPAVMESPNAAILRRIGSIMVAPAKGESVPDDGQRNGHGSSSSVRPRVGSKRFETIGLPTERLRAPVREVLAGDGKPEIT